MKRSHFFALGALVVGMVMIARTAPIANYPQTLTQPDGSVIHCFASGDEFNHWLHDKDGYTIVQHPATGYFVYALLKVGDLIPSDYVVGKVDPESVGLTSGVHPPSPALLQRRQEFNEMVSRWRGSTPTVGVLNNIVIFVRFSDESQDIFPDSKKLYDGMFNSSSSGDNSVYNYYVEASYGKLTISSTFYPIATVDVLSYQDTQPRNYFRPYNAVTNSIGYANDSDARAREQLMLKRAINAVVSEIPTGLIVDANGDGYVDDVCFVVSGDVDGWANQLWPHMDRLSLQSASINGKRVGAYDFQLRGFLMQETRGVCTLCHEIFHTLGAPDLYNYAKHLQPDELFPVWIWDIMGCKNQPNPMVNPPQHMCAYMKYKYGGWMTEFPVISTPGTYTLAPLQSATNNCYRILSPYSSSQYFVVEYRKRSGTFESSLPGEGLLVYRINTSASGNASGPPDEVYVYRPGGAPTANGLPDAAGLSANSGSVELTDFASSSSFLGDASLGGLNIIDVGLMGDSISFTLGPRLAATPRVVDFGKVDVGHTSDTVTIKLTNPDDASVSLISIASQSPNVALVIPSLPASIPKSGSFTFKAVFSPSETGRFNDTIVVRGDDPNHPLAGTILKGWGGPSIWTKDAHNPVLSGGAAGAWNRELLAPCVLFNTDLSRYEMWFCASAGTSSDWAPMSVGFASSIDGVNWTPSPTAVLSPTPGSWDEYTIETPWVIRESGQYKMWYTSYLSYDPWLGYIGYATSTDGIHWTKYSGNPVLGPGSAAWENDGPYSCSVVPYPGGYQMWYGAYPLLTYSGISGGPSIGHATSLDGIAWQRDSVHNPVLQQGGPGQWDSGYVSIPRVHQVGDTYYMWYEGRKRMGSTLTYHRLTGVAISTDMGVTWTKSADNPVLFPSAGTWDATRAVVGSVLQRGDSLDMWYAGSDATNLARIGHATSPIPIIIAVNEGGVNVPAAFELAQNYPNPFNPSTTITFELPARSRVKLTVFNILGQQVVTLAEGEMDAGYHEVKFDASHLPSGVYLYRLHAGNHTEVRKAVLMK